MEKPWSVKLCGLFMRRAVAMALIALLASSSLLVGSCGLLGKKPQGPFTTEFEISEGNIDFFLANDTLETAITGGPFYNGAQPLPSQNTTGFDTARAAKVEEIKAEAAALVKACDAAKPALAALRSEYTTFLDSVYKDEEGLEDIALETLNTVVLHGTMEVILEEEFHSLVAEETTQTYAIAIRDYLAVSKAVELAGLYLKDADTLASYSALMVNNLSASKNDKVKQAVAAYDGKMETLMGEAIKALEPVAQHVANVDLGLKQLASADYYFSLEAIAWMKAEQAKLDPVVAGLTPREGLTQKDVDDIKVFYGAFKELNSSMEQHAASIDTGKLIEVAEAPFPTLGIATAYAAQDYEAGKNYAAGTQVMQRQAQAETPKQGWLSSGWSAVKTGFGKVKTGVGVGVDALGLGVRNITSVGAGIYYGNSGKDIIENIMDNTKEAIDNYNKGVSGASTFTTADKYIKGVETGAGDAAGGATEWTLAKIFGKGKISGGAGWAVNGITKISVGMFTGMAKGIYKVANKESSTADVAVGFIEIGLGAIGGSKVLIKASQLPGLLKGGTEGVKAFSKIVTGMVGNAANASERANIAKSLAELLIKKGMTPDKAKLLISNTIKLEINQAVGRLIKNSREAMIKKIRDLIAKGGTGFLTNFQDTAKGALTNLVSKSFPKTLRGLLDALTTKMGSTPTKYIDNLVAGGLTNKLLKDLIKAALAIPPDPAQVNGTWKGSIIIVKVDIPESEAKRAEEAGCERRFKELEGKKNAMTLVLNLNESGSGTAELSGGTGDGSGSATYSDGAISMSITSAGSVFALKGAVAFKKEGGMTMAGSWRAPFRGSKIIMSGTFSAAK
ncbi:MAG: hypothetical protein KGZ93_01000 [Actinobacteria bacterium]|nr:hypothetical protein [Actinomycetota bacterium]